MQTAGLRSSIRYAYANAVLWGIGNGLASMTLVAYFAGELRASGTAIAWLLAAPSMAGLLRLAAPMWMERVRSRRRFCVGMFLASSAALAAAPAVAAPGVLPSAANSIVVLGASWTAYQVLEYMAVVALWSWYGDLVPARVRGRFVGRREACMMIGVVIGGLISAAATWSWQEYVDDAGRPELMWRGYAACAFFGAAMLAMAVLPLARMKDLPLVAQGERRTAAKNLRDVLAPLADRRFRRLMVFGIWFSMVNGLIQAPRQKFLADVLRLRLAEKRFLDAGSRGLQALALPWTGNVVDRRGNVPVLVASWAIVALAPLFLLPAGPHAKWWVVGAYVCWVAYAGVNVTLPNLMLGLSRAGQSASYAAAWFAWTQLAYSLSILAGGRLYDWLASSFEVRHLYGWRFDHFALLFVGQWALALAGLLLARRVPEPHGR